MIQRCSMLTLNDAELYPQGPMPSRHPEMPFTITSAAFSAIMKTDVTMK